MCKVDNRALKSAIGNEDVVRITEVNALLLAFIGLDSPAVKTIPCAESSCPPSNADQQSPKHYPTFLELLTKRRWIWRQRTMYCGQSLCQTKVSSVKGKHYYANKAELICQNCIRSTKEFKIRLLKANWRNSGIRRTRIAIKSMTSS